MAMAEAASAAAAAAAAKMVVPGLDAATPDAETTAATVLSVFTKAHQSMTILSADDGCQRGRKGQAAQHTLTQHPAHARVTRIPRWKEAEMADLATLHPTELIESALNETDGESSSEDVTAAADEDEESKTAVGTAQEADEEPKVAASAAEEAAAASVADGPKTAGGAAAEAASAAAAAAAAKMVVSGDTRRRNDSSNCAVGFHECSSEHVDLSADDGCQRGRITTGQAAQHTFTQLPAHARVTRIPRWKEVEMADLVTLHPRN